jgi:hypothetical protein
MAYITAALQLIQSYLSGKGWFDAVTIGEPDGPPSTPAAAIFLTAGNASQLTTTTFHRRRDVTVRIYMDVSNEPREDTEIALDKMVYDAEAALKGDLNLSTTGWVITPGTDIVETFDYVQLGGRPFRIADMVLPLSQRE